MVKARRGRIEVYYSKGSWRWRLIGGNGRITLPGEGHHSPSKVMRAIEDGRALMPTAMLVVIPREKGRSDAGRSAKHAVLAANSSAVRSLTKLPRVRRSKRRLKRIVGETG